jgi:hypothetical protein
VEIFPDRGAAWGISPARTPVHLIVGAGVALDGVIGSPDCGNNLRLG